MKSNLRFLLILGIGLSLALLLAACGGEGEESPAVPTFTGSISGSEAFVGLVREGSQVMAYVCDAQTIAEWFRGEVQDDSLELTSNSGATLQATFEGETAEGTFTPAGGSALAFTAETAALPAGLFRSEGTVEAAEYIGGLIVLADGRHRGLVSSGQQLFIVDPDPWDIQNGATSALANVDWGDGIISLPFNQVKINE